MRLKWYWFTLRRGLPVTFHLDTSEHRTLWRGIFGIAFRIGKGKTTREWFFGFVRSGAGNGQNVDVGTNNAAVQP
jgi:hypothetical protein